VKSGSEYYKILSTTKKPYRAVKKEITTLLYFYQANGPGLEAVSRVGFIFYDYLIPVIIEQTFYSLKKMINLYVTQELTTQNKCSPT